MKKMKRTLTAEMLTALVDTREQTPLTLNLASEVKGLKTGDYSVRIDDISLEDVVTVERKSLQDLIGCIGKERERFERCVDRMLKFQSKLLIIESTWAQLEVGGWRGQIQPSQVQGSLLSWMARGLPVMMAHRHDMAGRMVSRFLLVAARKYYRELLDLEDRFM